VLSSESGDHYYFALPGHYSIGDESDCNLVKALVANRTGEEEDCLYIDVLDSVSVGLNEMWMF
jgi:hypothetical protein